MTREIMQFVVLFQTSRKIQHKWCQGKYRINPSLHTNKPYQTTSLLSTNYSQSL